uniref:Uncharacterized protein n=1 Tax=Arundo donax TaxID=35708 RepID=A0A0A9E8G1_ARUDO
MHLYVRLQHQILCHSHVINGEPRENLGAVFDEEAGMDVGEVEPDAAAGVVGLEGDGEADARRRISLHGHEAAADRDGKLLGASKQDDGVDDDRDDEHRHGGSQRVAGRIEPQPER